MRMLELGLRRRRSSAGLIAAAAAVVASQSSSCAAFPASCHCRLASADSSAAHWSTSAHPSLSFDYHMRSSRGPAYGLHELEELQRDHQRLQETLLKERMERQEQMQRDKMERQEETREMQDRLARMEALLMQRTLALGPTCLRHRELHHHQEQSVLVLRVTTTLVI
ncbi:hypothetical protein Scep_004267 [Stephania cephalantha]|uniref:Uncharacterized protein n=1 Tax=Stephania cephalantha TaxID=152367 RepID=A0AAP0KS49_9MAGN